MEGGREGGVTYMFLSEWNNKPCGPKQHYIHTQRNSQQRCVVLFVPSTRHKQPTTADSSLSTCSSRSLSLSHSLTHHTQIFSVNTYLHSFDVVAANDVDLDWDSGRHLDPSQPLPMDTATFSKPAHTNSTERRNWTTCVLLYAFSISYTLYCCLGTEWYGNRASVLSSRGN